MGFEEIIAQETLDEKWSNRPDEITPEKVVDITKQMLLDDGKCLKNQKNNLSISQIYEKANIQLNSTSGSINPAKEIKNQSYFGRKWLKSSYEVSIILMKSSYELNN